jgi:hypothetical protein
MRTSKHEYKSRDYLLGNKQNNQRLDYSPRFSINRAFLHWACSRRRISVEFNSLNWTFLNLNRQNFEVNFCQWWDKTGHIHRTTSNKTVENVLFSRIEKWFGGNSTRLKQADNPILRRRPFPKHFSLFPSSPMAFNRLDSACHSLRKSCKSFLENNGGFV